MLIVDKPMPTNCYDCALDCCWVEGTIPAEYAEKRRPNCPIKGELPERHDRLVSEKAVRWAIDDIVLEIASRTGRVAMTKNETMEYVKRLPTIIEAERKNDGKAWH